MPNANTWMYYLKVTHIFQTNTIIYRNNFSLWDKQKNSLLAAFWQIFCSWHLLA